MMHIAVIIPAVRSEVRTQLGLRYWGYIIEALEKIGCRVTVFTGEAPHTTNKKIVGCGGWQVTLGYNWSLRLFHPRMIWKIAGTLPDVVLSVEYSLAALLGLVAARRCGAKFVIFQEHSPKRRLELGTTKRLWRKILLRSADLIVANTEEARRNICRINKSCAHKVRVVPLLVPPEQDILVKKKIKLPTNSHKPVFTYVGRLIKRKNVLTLIHAAGYLRWEGYNFTVWVVGDGPERTNLERTVREQGLDGMVRFLGNVPYESLGFVYSKSDVFVMPCFFDYRSVAVLEAIRFGKPVIDSERDGNAGVTVLDGINGFVVNPYDVKGLAYAMKQFLKFPELVAQMSEGSLLVASQMLPMPIESAKQLRRCLQGKLA